MVQVVGAGRGQEARGWNDRHRGSPVGASPRGYPLSWFEGWMFAKWAAEEKAFQAKGIVQAKVWDREGDRSVGHLSGGLGFLPKALWWRFWKTFQSSSLRLDLPSPQPTPHSVLLGRGMPMTVLLLEAKPSLEGKVKARGSGASPSTTWDSLDAGLLLWRHKSSSLRLPLSLRPLPCCWCHPFPGSWSFVLTAIC